MTIWPVKKSGCLFSLVTVALFIAGAALGMANLLMGLESDRSALWFFLPCIILYFLSMVKSWNRQRIALACVIISVAIYLCMMTSLAFHLWIARAETYDKALYPRILNDYWGNKYGGEGAQYVAHFPRTIPADALSTFYFRPTILQGGGAFELSIQSSPTPLNELRIKYSEMARIEFNVDTDIVSHMPSGDSIPPVWLKLSPTLYSSYAPGYHIYILHAEPYQQPNFWNHGHATGLAILNDKYRSDKTPELIYWAHSW